MTGRRTEEGKEHDIGEKWRSLRNGSVKKGDYRKIRSDRLRQEEQMRLRED